MRLWWGWASVLLLSFSGAPASTPEEECSETYREFRPRYEATRYIGVEMRDGLRQELRELFATYRTAAPVCAGRVLESLAYLLVFDRHFPEADRTIRDFLEGPGRETTVLSQFRLLQQRGYALIQLGEARESAQDYFRAGSLANQLGAVDGVGALVYAARSARWVGDFDTSQRYLDSAYELVRDSLSSSPLRDELEGVVLQHQTYILEDRLLLLPEGSEEYYALNDQLEETARRTLELLPQNSPRRLGHHALLLNIYASTSARRGNFAEAERRHAPALDLAQRAGLQTPGAIGEVWYYKAQFAQMRGDLKAARQAFEIARREAIRRARIEAEVKTIEKLGEVAELEGDFEEAIRNYRTAIAWRDAQRTRLGLQDWAPPLSRAEQEARRGLARVQYTIGEHRAAFVTLDGTRARYLQDLRRHLDLRRRLSTEDQRRVDSLQSALEEERIAMLRENVPPTEHAAATLRISTLREELDRITGPAPVGAPELDVDSLQTALGQSDQTLVSYFLDDKMSLAFVVRADTFVTVPLEATPPTLAGRIKDIGGMWQSDAQVPDPAFRLDVLHQLYLDLVEPIAEWLDEDVPVIVIPDGPVAAIPFGMLLTAPATEYSEAPYLVRRHPISTELAASMVLENSEAAPSSPRFDLVAFGRSEFARSTWNGEALADLPHVRDEVRQIGRGIPSAVLALDEDATEENLEAYLAEARIVHLASHAETHPALPLYSRIALWDGETADGTLHLYELQGRALPADLVVLSGCSTARGHSGPGEGMMGLQYAVRSAGSKASLATLWPVDDDATVILMAAFYDGLKAGLTKDRALQRAQLAYLDTHTGLDASPFYWAGPVLSGDPSPIPLRTPPRWPIWGSALLLGGLVLAWLTHRRRNA